jgi:hypothetical protein
MGGNVFLSYCRDDRNYVDKLVGFLGESGVPVWFDDHRAPGDQWLDELRRRVEEADAVVVVMTPAAEQSDWVRIEIQQACDTGRPILPLLLDGEPFRSLRTTQYLDVRGRRLPGEAFLARVRSAPTAPLTQRPVRMIVAGPDLVRDVIDVRADCETATSVLGLLARMVRVLRADRADERTLHGPAATTIGAVKAVLPRQYGRPGRARPLRVDERFATDYATRVAEVLTAIRSIGGERGLARFVPLAERDRPAGLSIRLDRASRAIESARTAARALAGAVYCIGVDVCGLDLSALVVADLEQLDGFLWDSTTRWPRKLVDAIFERSISTGDGTMLIRTPIS